MNTDTFWYLLGFALFWITVGFLEKRINSGVNIKQKRKELEWEKEKETVRNNMYRDSIHYRRFVDENPDTYLSFEEFMIFEDLKKKEQNEILNEEKQQS